MIESCILLKKNGILVLPCGEVNGIDNLENFEAQFSTLLRQNPTYTRLEFQTQNRNFKISSFL